jgi:hypothetical protein
VSASDLSALQVERRIWEFPDDIFCGDCKNPHLIPLE